MDAVDKAGNVFSWFLIGPYILIERLTKNRAARVCGFLLCVPWMLLMALPAMLYAIVILFPLMIWDLTKDG